MARARSEHEAGSSVALPSPADTDREAHMASLVHRLASRLQRTASRGADRELAQGALVWLVEEGMANGMRQEQRPLPFPSACACGRTPGDVDGAK
jgi:hypothetical protein